MTAESDERKRVYALLGETAAEGQCVENSLATYLLGIRHLHTEPVDGRTFEELQAAGLKQTAGALLKQIVQLGGLDQDGEEAALLAAVVKKRNWLVHDFFRERFADLASTAGRAKMIVELEGMRADFIRADRHLHCLVNATLEWAKAKEAPDDALLARNKPQPPTVSIQGR